LGDIGNKALVTLDGTDMPVEMKFSEEFMSHKLSPPSRCAPPAAAKLPPPR
jgi:hypothetical protein